MYFQKCLFRHQKIIPRLLATIYQQLNNWSYQRIRNKIIIKFLQQVCQQDHSQRLINNRYFILSYTVEFDKVNYPLVLSYDEISGVKELKSIIMSLKQETKIVLDDEQLRQENQELKQQIEDLQKQLENNQQNTNQLGAVEENNLRETIEMQNKEKKRILSEQKQEIIELQNENKDLQNQLQKKNKSNTQVTHQNAQDNLQKKQEIQKLKQSIKILKEKEIKQNKTINDLKNQIKKRESQLNLQKKTTKVSGLKQSAKIQSQKGSIYGNIRAVSIKSKSRISKNSLKTKDFNKRKPPVHKNNHIKKTSTKVLSKKTKNKKDSNLLAESQDSIFSEFYGNDNRMKSVVSQKSMNTSKNSKISLSNKNFSIKSKNTQSMKRLDSIEQRKVKLKVFQNQQPIKNSKVGKILNQRKEKPSKLKQLEIISNRLKRLREQTEKDENAVDNQ